MITVSVISFSRCEDWGLHPCIEPTLRPPPEYSDTHLRQDRVHHAGAVGVAFLLDAQGLHLGQPEIRQGRAALAVDVRAEFQPPATAASDDQGQVVVLVGRAVTQSAAQGEDGIVQQCCAVGLLNAVHSLEQSREGGNVEAIQF